MNASASATVPLSPPSQSPPNARPGGSRRPPSPAKSKPKPATPPAPAPRFIPPDWQPGERVYAWATKQGLTRDWVEDQVDEFITFWTDAGIKRRSWDATFIHRMQYLQTHQKPQKQEKTHVISHTGLADKDYDKGATPFDQIPWLNDADVP
ncbi:DnaT-like ssDNA-binding domain-containing protein [Thiorhodovibrio frisius]|nr:DnaT-like ssDNA-binding domain-containing protein [Thiorhodovibrio frisius]